MPVLASKADNPTNALTGFRALPLYLGGFLGPFGTMVIIPMFPELRDRFGVDSATITWGFSAYLFPMALFLLVSGTIGERYGRRRILQISFSAYVVASLACAAAPSLAVFLTARAAQGVANSFISPLLIAGLAEVTPSAQLGRRLGTYASFQAVGGGMAPFLGGLATHFDWRYAFLGTAVISVPLALFTPPGVRRAGADRPRIKPLLSFRLITLGVGSLAAAAGPIGAGVLVGFKARDVLDMEPTTAGILLAGGNFAAVIVSPVFGRMVDRFGPRLCGIASAAVVSGLMALLGFADSPTTTALIYVPAAALFGFVMIVFQKVGASIVPDNRGGALSAILSFRFIGHAVGPLLWVPVFNFSNLTAFVGAASLGIITVLAFALAIPSATTKEPLAVS